MNDKMCLLLLRDVPLGMQSLQKVSVNFLPLNLLAFAEGLALGMQSLQRVSVNFLPLNLFDFAEGPAPWHAISTACECQFLAIKSV